MEMILSTRGLVHAVAPVLFALIARFLYKLYKVRTHVRSFMKTHGLKSPPHSFFFGSRPAISKIMTKYHADVALQSIPTLLLLEYPELQDQGIVCMDSWPITDPIIAVFHPDMMAQFAQNLSLPKSDILRQVFGGFTGCQDLVCAEGSHWKKWRSIFNSGFSNKNILSLIPAFIEEINIFKDILVDAAGSGRTMQLITPATKATCDVIGRAISGARLGIQTSESRLYKAMKHQLALAHLPRGLKLWRDCNLWRHFKLWNNNRIMHTELMPDIEREFRDTGMGGGSKTITGLAVEAYLKENGDIISATRKDQLFDSDFLSVVLAQIKIFLVAGHDTTASTLCYVYYCLHRDPAVADRVRAEHDAILGTDPSAAATVLADDPSILHRLIYTSAVIKETLRLYPPAATLRAGTRNLELVHPETRQRFSTEGFTLLAASQTAHRHPAYWPQPDTFLPERWLAREGDRLHPLKDAWRPFELGPRNCIGQELAMAELKLILALTVREVDVVPAYSDAAPRLFGEVAYQIYDPNEINNRPKDGMPVRVKLRA